MVMSRCLKAKTEERTSIWINISLLLSARFHLIPQENGTNLFNNNPLKRTVVPLPAQTAFLGSNGSLIINGRWVPNKRNYLLQGSPG